MHELDHILWGTSNLDAGAETFARLSGVPLGGGGSHPGFGTRNKLASLGEGLYFEAIAPDPQQQDHKRARRTLPTLRSRGFPPSPSAAATLRATGRGRRDWASGPAKTSP